jgi:hypothetical protein
MAFPIPAVPAVTRARFPLNSFAIDGNLVDVMILCLTNVLNLAILLHAHRAVSFAGDPARENVLSDLRKFVNLILLLHFQLCLRNPSLVIF